MELNSIAHAKFEDYILGIPNGSVDLIATDPPYTDGKGKDVLLGHKIQTVLDLDFIAQQHFRILKPNSFYAFFGQMPSITAWEDASYKAGFEWCQEVIVAKKKGGAGGNLRFKKSHEKIYIFKKGDPKYNKTNGTYSDVSQALVEYSFKDIESVFRQLSYWKGIAQGKILKNTTLDSKANDDFYKKKKLVGCGQSKTLGGDYLNFNTVWAFSSHNLKHRNPINGQIKHPTVKNIDCVGRLIELCSFDNATVFDGFGGSGTTYLACKRTNRNFVGCEIDADYYKIITDRLAKEDKIINSTLKF